MFSGGSDWYSLGVWTTSDPKLMAHLDPLMVTSTVSHQGYSNQRFSLHCFSWQRQVLFSWAPKSLQTVTTAMKLEDACSAEEKL